MPYLSQAAGRVWFEVEVVEAKGRALVGFAGTNFCGSMVGYEDAVSWGINAEGKRYHGRYTPPRPPASFTHPAGFAPSSRPRMRL